MVIVSPRPDAGRLLEDLGGRRAECVMLNKGPFLAEGISFLADVLLRMDRHTIKNTARLAPLHSWPLSELGLTSA